MCCSPSGWEEKESMRLLLRICSFVLESRQKYYILDAASRSRRKPALSYSQ
jgi:hypothetical protein